MAPPTDGPIAHPQAHLSPEDRATAFATGKVPIDRGAALRAGSVPVPRKFIHWIIAGFAVLAVGGVLVEHFIGNAGGRSTIGQHADHPGWNQRPRTPAPAPPSGPPVSSSLNAFIGLSQLAGNRAPAISLQDPNGNLWTLAYAPGKVTVLAFFNSACDDICPVLAKEIAQADRACSVQGCRG